MDKNLTYIMAGMFAVIILFYMATTMQDIAEPTVDLEGITFAANNTEYATANDQVDGLVLYYFNNVTFPIPTTLYTYDTDGVTIYTNSSVAGYPNVTNTTYYATYYYRTDATVWSIDFNFVGLLVFLAACIVIVMKLTGQKK